MGQVVYKVSNKDKEDLVSMAERLTSLDMSYRSEVDAQAFLPVLFYLGFHWVTRSEKNRFQYRDVNLRGDQEPGRRVPRPVTNVTAELADYIIAFLSKVEPHTKVFPARDTESDILGAEVAQNVLDGIDEEIGLDSVRDKICRLLVLTGDAFVLTGTDDRDGFARDRIGLDLEQTKSDVEELINGGGGVGMDGRPSEELVAMLSYGRELEKKMAGLRSEKSFFHDAFWRFQVYANLNVDNVEDQEMIVVVHSKSHNQIKDRYGDKVFIGTDTDLYGMRYLESIPYLSTTNVSSLGADFWNRAGAVGTASLQNGMGYIKQVWKSPSKKYPRGAVFEMVSGKIVDGPYPLPVDSYGRPFIPIAHAKFDAIPGSFFGHSPLLRLLPMNYFRNQIESNIQMMGYQASSSVLAMPHGTKIVGTNRTRVMSGDQLWYSSVGEHSGRPEWLKAPGIDQSNVEYMRYIDQKMGDLVAVAALVRGDMPPSGTPDASTERLIRQGMTRFGPVMRSIADMWKTMGKHKLEMFREDPNATVSRRSMDSEGTVSVKSFMSADITGGVNLVVDSDSTTPKSEVVEATKFQIAINMGLLDVNDPVQKWKALKSLGRLDLAGHIDVQYKAASEENRRMLAGESVEVLSRVDDHAIHIYTCRKMAADPNTPMNVKAVAQQHIMDHERAQIEEQLELQAMANPQPPMAEGDVGDAGPVEGVPPPEGILPQAGTREPPSIQDIPVDPSLDVPDEGFIPEEEINR